MYISYLLVSMHNMNKIRNNCPYYLKLESSQRMFKRKNKYYKLLQVGV